MKRDDAGHERRADPNGDFEPGYRDYYDLMKFHVSDILLVSSLYDAFILEEDGLISEQLSGKYRDLALSSPPRVMRVSSGGEALDELKEMRYDLVITMTRLGDMDPFEFGRKAKERQPGVPVVLLVTDLEDLPKYHEKTFPGVDKVFFWNGDTTLFLAITKYFEDAVNVEHDTEKGLVKVILVIENSARYYSMFLSLIYTEVMEQTNALISEGLNETERHLRRRTRPRILLAETYDEAMHLYLRYRESILGIITDVSYPREGRHEGLAGFQFVESVDRDTPVLVQSSKPEHARRAAALGLPFLDKNSITLLQDLRGFFAQRLGFGDFVFRTPKGKVAGRARDIREFCELLPKVPAESIRLHGEANQFSNWLLARGEIALARRLRPKKVSDFKSDEEIRGYLFDAIRESMRERQLGIITDFPQQTFEFDESFTRFGGGSLGGKGRGIAFLSALLQMTGTHTIAGVRVRVPDSLAIGTEEFDRFLADNDLAGISKKGLSDAEIARRFLAADLSRDLRRALQRYLAHTRVPIAVRSSSLLEDSQNQPFAGIYSTYLLPNAHARAGVRLAQLCQAVQLVYASAFFKAARAYIQTTVQKVDEEKMAVVVQKLVGRDRNGRFYPLFSGVAQSHNFYPIAPLRREDGVATVALGLGKTVVEGGKALSFSPARPDIVLGSSSAEEMLKNSQNRFYALDAGKKSFDLSEGEDVTLLSLDLSDAEGDGTLEQIVSTYDRNDGRLRDGLDEGPKVVTFAGVLKYGHMPLPEILRELLSLGQRSVGRPVELEFAVEHGYGGRPEFHILQIRPLVALRERRQVAVSDGERKGALVYTDKALGNGMVEGIYDVVFVPPETFDPARTRETADEIGDLNRAIGRPYLLVGPGRWGTRDRWLGIPVSWDQISWARAIVEVALEDFRIDPSHGSHFFHNLTALGIPYFTVPYGTKDVMDWRWLGKQPAARKNRYVAHLRLKKALVAKVDGRTGKGAVIHS
ncbi:MAG: hypothetical protein HZB92_06710 [Euryarchaeota archaeon]|nr:hypothetical protein [Euryarchaeota archaeon]